MKKIPERPKRLVNIAGGKGRAKYLSTLKDIARSGVCPLCPKTMRWHTKPILKRHRGWLITENLNLYKNAQHHFLVIGQTHKENMRELNARDWSAIAFLLNWAIKKYHIKGGGIAMRFGEPAYTGATIRHLHLHLLMPRIARDKAKSVHFGIG